LAPLTFFDPISSFPLWVIDNLWKNSHTLYRKNAATTEHRKTVEDYKQLNTRSPASAGIANRPLVFLGIFLIFGLG